MTCVIGGLLPLVIISRLLHCLQKCTTEIRLEINVPSQKHDSTVKTVEHLGVPLGWIARAFSCLISVSRYGFSGVFCVVR